MSARARRPPEARFRLAVQLSEHIAANDLVRSQFGIEIYSNAKGWGTAVKEGADAHVTRDFLSEVRKFDAPGEDVYIPVLHDLMWNHGVERSWQDGLRGARQHYDTGQATPPEFIVVDVDVPVSVDCGPTFVAAREAFELWAYGRHLHNDYEKELRLARFPATDQDMLHYTALWYMSMLAQVAIFTAKVIVLGLDPLLSPAVARPSWVTDDP